MELNSTVRRGLSLFIPILTILTLFGGLQSIFQINPTESLFNTGINFNIILALLNGALLFWVYKHRVP